MKATSYLKKVFVLLALLFFTQFAQAQTYPQINYSIDSLLTLGLPKSALVLVDKLDALARKQNNVPQMVHAAIYRMMFQSYAEENSLVAIITRLKQDIDKADYPVKPVLQSILASMYYNYYQQNRWQMANRTRLEKPSVDFTKWDIQTLIDETTLAYKASLDDAKREQSTPIDILDGVLKGDPSIRYLRPTLYDLLVQRAFEFFLLDEPSLTKPKQPFSVNDARFFGDSRAFADLSIKTTDTTSTWYNGVKYLQQATRFHLEKKEDEALADLDIQRLDFLHNKSVLPDRDSLYTRALKHIATTFPAKPISADAWLALGKYHQQNNNFVYALWYLNKAADAFPTSHGGKNAIVAMSEILQKSLTASVENVNLPGVPVLAQLQYRNVKSVKLTIYQLTVRQEQDFMWNKNQYYGPNRLKTINTMLNGITPVQQKTIQFPLTHDYRNHNIEFSIDPLAVGDYLLRVEDPSTADSSLIQLTGLQVSRLAGAQRTNPNGNVEFIATDRQSGQPLKDILVKAFNNQYDQLASGYTDKNGMYRSDIKNNSFLFNMMCKGDTLLGSLKYGYGAVYDPSNEKEKDDNKTVLFTDRQIYRPGQAVYFKGIQLNLYQHKTTLNTTDSVTVYFKDANSQIKASLGFKPNEFGTFAGKFVIPQNILSGNSRIETVDGQVNFQIEDYKRPTFQAEFLPVKQSYKLNDSVKVKGRVTTFSGYGLSQAKVAYHITRSQTNYYGGMYGRNYAQAVEIKTDTITTDSQGAFQINFKAIPGEVANLNSIIYNYNITVDVTDASGETHSANTAIGVSNNNIQIVTYLPAEILPQDTGRIALKLNNLNGQMLKGTAKVKVSALESPGHLFKNRLWQLPDTYLMSKAEYQTKFPDYVYSHEDNPVYWPVLNEVINNNVAVSDTAMSYFNLKALTKYPSGMYRVVIKGQSLTGDTTSITQYIRYVGEEPQPTKISDWVTIVQNNVPAGTTAQFIVGVDKPCHVLMEKYKGPKIIQSQWLDISKGQRYINVPTSTADSDISVQFMMIYQNRMYASYQKINLQRPNKSLDIKFLTYRDKLQPGEKEQWKLQVSSPGNEKQAAEMVASLYDASLDNVATPQNWINALETPERYHGNYYNWNSYDFIAFENTSALVYKYYNYPQIQRNYEVLDMMDYNYYGNYNYGYRQYIDKARQRLNLAKNDVTLENNYAKNAALVKNGVDVVGKIKSKNDGGVLPGVTIKIKGTDIYTSSNSDGNFKIKVPVNGVLVFSFIGFQVQELTITKAADVKVALKASSSSLNEVVVTGYGTMKKTELTGSVSTVSNIMIRGAATLNGKSYDMALAGRVAGVQVSMDTVNYQASAYSIRLSDKVLARSITPRTNFNETAFFYPQLRTDEKGQILIDFTIPESLTKWKFKAFAHTQDLKSGYIESTVVTQKQLSITANTPRFLREGDSITISARLVNLTSGVLKGKVNLQLFNAINMQPVNLLVNPADAQQNFEVAALTNKPVSFKLFIPFGIDALTYRLTADAGTFTDGEENTLPILPNRMLVTESMPMMVRSGQTRSFTFDKLVNQISTTLKNKSLTLEYTQNPAWYAVQALPYMMEFPYECSEQIFSRYYANSLGTSLVSKLPIVKQMFDQWKATNSTELLSNLEKNQELKATLLEETPWLRDAANESERKKRIALLFDMDKMSCELSANLDKLKQKQLPDGGFPWFGGDRSDVYITRHILEGIGQLVHLKIVDIKDRTLSEIGQKAMEFSDEKLKEAAAWYKEHKTYNTRTLGSTEIYAWYVQSFFPDFEMDSELESMQTSYLKLAEKQWVEQGIYEQALIALTMLRNDRPDVAQKIINSLKETAQTSDDMGMYWAKNQRGYYWYQSPVETQSLMIALFTEAGNNDKAVEEMKIWLLRNKQTNDWKTTTATAAACYALLLKADNWLADKGTSVIKLDNKTLTDLKPELKAEPGTGYIKTAWADEQVKPAMGKVSITNNGKTVSWGALHWQYLENLDKITPSSTDIHIERKYYIQKQTDRGAVLTEIDAAHKPKPGDLLKVVVYLKAGRDYEYVQLKDMRPAGTEPVDVISTYKYQDGLFYYQVTKDVATNFFISQLNKGNYVFEYRLRVAQSGNFSTGISTVQCMYAPEFNAHSEGSRMVIGN